MCSSGVRQTLINKLLWLLLYVLRFPPKIITFIRIWVIVCNLSVSFSLLDFLHFIAVAVLSSHSQFDAILVVVVSTSVFLHPYAGLMVNFLCDWFLCGSKFIFLSHLSPVCMCCLFPHFYFMLNTPDTFTKYSLALLWDSFGSKCMREKKHPFVFYSLILCALFLYFFFCFIFRMWMWIQTKRYTKQWRYKNSTIYENANKHYILVCSFARSPFSPLMWLKFAHE